MRPETYKINYKENKEDKSKLKEFAEALETNAKKLSPENILEIIKDKKFVLVGEYHLPSPSCELLRTAIVELLPNLREAGFTHIALEISSEFQERIDNLDVSKKSINEIEKELGDIVSYGVGKILIVAKQLGFKILCIDYPPASKLAREGKLSSLSSERRAVLENYRDFYMMKRIEQEIQEREEKGEECKFLIYIGEAHIHKRSVESYGKFKVVRLGARLSKKYKDEVISFRFQLPESSFDKLFYSSQPKIIDIVKETSFKQGEIYFVEDSGVFKGDPRVSATDYVIFTTENR